MTCIQPGVVTPDDLIAYTDDEASPLAVAHIHACPSCAAEAGAYARQQRRLRRRLARFACPSPQTLADFEFGLLETAAQREVAGHLVECPRCRDELATLRAFLAVEPEPEPTPVGSVARVRRLVAALLAPPLAGPALGRLRGADAGAPQVFAAGEYRITVTAGPPGARPRPADLVGLIWREGDAAASLVGTASLIAASGERRTAEIDDLGNFGFAAVEPGVYELEAAVAGDSIVVNALTIGG